MIVELVHGAHQSIQSTEMKEEKWKYDNYEDYSEVEAEDTLSSNNEFMSKLDFLTSSRFWAMVIGAVSIYLKAKGWIGEPEMLLIAIITAGFTVIRTADRISEQKVLAAGIASGKIEPEQVTKIPPKE